MIFPDSFGFYAILTDPLKGYEYLTEVLVEQEISVVQLRDKRLSEFDLLKVAEKMRKITEGSNTLFIMNDSPVIALDSGADGVHVGQDDMKPSEVRAMVGKNMLIGLSTHNPTQTLEAQNTPIDYIGVGPVFATPTKDIPDPVLGYSTMGEMVQLSKVPAVCLGGISLAKLPEVLRAGARNFSLVRPLCIAEDPRKVIAQIQEVYQNHKLS